jgi:hypothetical protein
MLNFALADLTVVGGTIDTGSLVISGDDKRFQFTVTPTSATEQIITVDIAAGMCVCMCY